MLVAIGVLIGVAQLTHASDQLLPVEISGVIRSIARANETTELALSNADGITLVRLSAGDAAEASLIDAAVRIRGQWAPVKSDSGMVIRREFVAAPQALTVVTPAIAHDDLVVRPVADVLRDFHPDPLSHRVRVQGVVTRIGDESFYIADAGAGLQVAFTEPPRVSVGDRVDIAGFPDARSRRPSLTAATVHRLGPGAEPRPRPVTAWQASSGRYHAMLVRIEATLSSINNVDGRRTLTMKDREIAFEVRMPDGAAVTLPEIGGTLAVVGVASNRFDEHGRPGTFIVYPRRAGDIEVVAAGPWFLSSRAVTGLSILGGLGLLSLGWLLVVNRKIPATERALERSEARYREIFERSPAGNFVTRHDGTIVTCNAAFARMLGYASADLMKSVNARALYVDPSERDAFMRRLQRKGRMEALDITLKRADGTVLHGLASALARFDAAGNVEEVEGYVIDLSRQKEAEAALLASQAQLRRSQRLEAMGRLAGGVSHDFSNLLTAILGHADLVLHTGQLNQEDRAHVEGIQKAATSATSLTRQLLAFSRSQVLTPATLDLNVVVADVAEMLTRILGENVALVTQLADEPAYLLADRGQLEQVLINLAVNARDAMSPSGGRLALVVALNGTDVRLQVRDTGAGIAPDVLPHIFEPFFTTKDAGAGTGLGLATVYGIVTQSGGTIDVQSTEGMGTTFLIRFPRFHAAPEAATHREQAPAYTTTADETVLVVEDEAAVRGLVQMTLERAGYSVVVAEDAPSALRILETSPSSIDLVLSDVVMPKISGAELTVTLRSLYPKLKVLLMSGYVGSAGCPMPELPADVPLLQKPFTPKTLTDSIRAALAGSGSAAAVAAE
jgi:PAS domain S-box-containing protein